MIEIEIVYALPEKQDLRRIRVEEGTRISEAIKLSGMLTSYPEIDLTSQSVGLFSKVQKEDTELREGDRIEIYRPLIADPKEVRKKKALKQKS